ncbi:CRISPR-associated endonuclease Cas2 [Hydrogenivirga sp. 128-5-R1-1]|uniref:CRISPR-associated endonuclease Cas2 n=1 Tax=Hydrogenivirga sp. 128-5-R1-1 TaxID=392423 RepID=UPI00015F0CDB|nr:CRISPR-associated endonuclease Cas2 [Hydrogenivirga sp. 128-5-R1-1]EDP75965.1 hypothetical protein HG1285_06550 [Hydrogenivirga sp. 128-5-R1-1]
MKVILVYDIATEEPKDQQRLNKVRKIVRRYITHVQKSVFEGELTKSKLERMKSEILRVVDREKDSVIIYVLEDSAKYERQLLTDVPDLTDNIL